MAPNDMAQRLANLLGADSPKPPSIRMTDFSAYQRTAVLDVYHSLGGMDVLWPLEPNGWDMVLHDGTIIEFDESQHFNRYRHATLVRCGLDFPWTEAYKYYCKQYESIAKASGNARSGKRSPKLDGLSVAEMQFGVASGRGGNGNPPRWKQRAVYDMMRDFATACVPGRRLARLSAYDDVAGVCLGSALAEPSTIDVAALHRLIDSRTAAQ